MAWKRSKTPPINACPNPEQHTYPYRGYDHDAVQRAVALLKAEDFEGFYAVIDATANPDLNAHVAQELAKRPSGN